MKSRGRPTVTQSAPFCSFAADERETRKYELERIERIGSNRALALIAMGLRDRFSMNPPYSRRNSVSVTQSFHEALDSNHSFTQLFHRSGVGNSQVAVGAKACAVGDNSLLLSQQACSELRRGWHVAT